jgi:hypothetical protein
MDDADLVRLAPWLAGSVSLLVHAVIWGALALQPAQEGLPTGHVAAHDTLSARLITANDPTLPQQAETAPVLPIQQNTQTPPAPLSPQTTTANAPQPDTPDALPGNTPMPSPLGAYLSADKVDVAPVPVSAPDTRSLQGMVVPHPQVGLRIYVDAWGKVQEVMVKVPDEDRIAYEPLRQMFFATGFIPGRKDRQDVATYLDIEINISDVIRLN